MKDRTFVGQTIDCPDCQALVLIRLDVQGGIVGESVTASPMPQQAHISVPGPTVSERTRRWTSAVLSPVRIAWIVAASLTVGLIVWMTLSPAEDESPSSVSNVLETAPVGPSPERSLVVGESPNADLSPSEQRLTGLSHEVAAIRSKTGAWPVGTAGDPSLAPEHRFSWLAVLAAQGDPNGPQPRWDRAWNDRMNERFVRQRQDAYLNPMIARQTGQDGYPTTHLVGVTGVGPDSARLPVGHPRAGVFGDSRVTTLGDIPDGLGNTLLVAGIESDLGSWAAAGRSTLRGFNAEPYLRGPDGFGTGQADGMFVLMADGSTRFLSSKTDPIILRRMAAAADGLPLDVNVKGEPGLRSEEPAEVAGNEVVEDALDEANIEKIVAQLAQPFQEPLDVPLAEDDPQVDITALLAQPIARFEQQQPMTARELITMLEEMVTVEIDTSSLPQAAATRLEQPIKFSLHDTTVGDILAALLSEVSLTYAVRDNRLDVIDLPTATD